MKYRYKYQHPDPRHPFNMGKVLTGLPQHYAGMTIDDYIVDPKDKSQAPMLAAKRSVEDFIERLDVYRKTGTGMMFYGPSGYGKTMLACVAMQSGIAQIHPWTVSSYMARFITMDQFADWVYTATFGKDKSPEEVYWATKHLEDIESRTNFVMFDDVGKEYHSAKGFVESKFDHVLRNRRNNGLLTFITSNNRPDQWAGTYNPSMTSFLYEICNVNAVFSRDDPDASSYLPPTTASNYRERIHIQNKGRPQLVSGRTYPVFATGGWTMVDGVWVPKEEQ